MKKILTKTKPAPVAEVIKVSEYDPYFLGHKIANIHEGFHE